MHVAFLRSTGGSEPRNRCLGICTRKTRGHDPHVLTLQDGFQGWVADGSMARCMRPAPPADTVRSWAPKVLGHRASWRQNGGVEQFIDWFMLCIYIHYSIFMFVFGVRFLRVFIELT